MADEMDILREAASIAAGHGSTALSDMLGRKISLRFPSIDIITPLEAPAKLKVDEIAIIIFSKILVGLDGEIAIILSRENASKLINLSYRMANATDKEKEPGFITEFSLSILKEIGNVIIASYLNALSLMFKRMIVPPIPTLISGSVEDVLNVVLTTHKDVNYCYLIESVFQEKAGNLEGGFFLFLSPYAAHDIKVTCRKMLDDVQK